MVKNLLDFFYGLIKGGYLWPNFDVGVGGGGLTGEIKLLQRSEIEALKPPHYIKFWSEIIPFQISGVLGYSEDKKNIWNYDMWYHYNFSYNI